MNSRLAFSVISCIALAQAQDQPPVINTPTSLAQCLPSMLTFSGGSPPYTISALPAGQVSAAPLVDLGTQSGPNFTWKVNLAAGTTITLQIRDSKGVLNYAQAVTVQSSSDASCLGSNAGSSGPPSPPTPTSPNAPVSTGSSNTPPPSPNLPPTPASNSSAVPSTTTNTTSVQRPNSTATTAGSNSTVNATSIANQPKGPSVFTPPLTSGTSNTSPASTNAQNSAASIPAVHSKDLFAGLAIAGAALTLFA